MAALKNKKRRNNASSSALSKKRKLDAGLDEPINSGLIIQHNNKYTVSGTVLSLGVGDTGQLGLGSDILERTKPSKFSPASLKSAGLDDQTVEEFVQVVAGGMHSVCLTANGRVFSFGCNDEGALGRASTDIAPDEDDDNMSEGRVIEETRPGIVTFPENVKIVMITAGDSHSAALDSEGRVWLWGTFRGSSGVLGLTKADEICKSPIRIFSIDKLVVKIASGQDHLVCLTEDGRLLTMGCAEQGQLGRIAERFAKDGGRNGLDLLLQPGECRLKGGTRFSDVWAGGFATIARGLSNGKIYGCGLNNYGQLALVSRSKDKTLLSTTTTHQPQKISNQINSETVEVSEREQMSESMLLQKQGPLVQFMLTPALGFEAHKNWQQFAIGMHHTLALTMSGEVYSVGRSDYGRLGCGHVESDGDSSAVSQPQLVQGGLAGHKCGWVGCGEACSFAVDCNGVAYSWGMGSSQQLAQDDEDEDVAEPSPMVGKNLSSRCVLMIDAGGQHTLMLARDPTRAIATDVEPPKTEIPELSSKSIAEEPMDTTTTGEESHVIEPKKINGIKDDQDVVMQTKEKNTKVEEKTETVIIAKKPKLDETKTIVIQQPTDVEEALPVVVGDNDGILMASPSECPPSLAEASTAGATVNSSSMRSFSMASDSQSQAVSDGVSNCSNSSAASVVSSAQSIDGGGSSRLSSLGGASAQSSLFAQPVNDEGHAVEVRVDEARRRGGFHWFPPRGPINASVGGGMSICSTSSEPGFPLTDTTSFGSMTASPLDLLGGGGDSGNTLGGGGFPVN